jgi:hypothetical protein
MQYLIQRLQEASTWQGIILVSTSLFHFNLGSEMSADIVAAGVALAGIANMVLPDKLKGA